MDRIHCLLYDVSWNCRVTLHNWSVDLQSTDHARHLLIGLTQYPRFRASSCDSAVRLAVTTRERTQSTDELCIGA